MSFLPTATTVKSKLNIIVPFVILVLADRDPCTETDIILCLKNFIHRKMGITHQDSKLILCGVSHASDRCFELLIHSKAIFAPHISPQNSYPVS